MQVRILEDPARASSWGHLVQRHPAASIFHSPGWLSALQQTYGYEPFVVTTTGGSSLPNAIVACRVNGWTSSRLVSLPFSDHCDPLVSSSDDLTQMLMFLIADARKRGAGSVELRPTQQPLPSASTCGMWPSDAYSLHRLDLRPGAAEMFRRFHHSTRRAIRRAEREGLTYEAGTTDRLLADFYRLLRMTRRRHRLPPQPMRWFRNLLSNLGDSASIHIASKNAEPIASILTLSFKDTLYYKYGGSDATHHRLGGMPFLFWRAIQDAPTRGFQQLDLGRSDLDQPGLIAFKDHLGATQSPLTYYRHPRPRSLARSGWMSRLAREPFAYLPDAALDLAGELIYKRLG